MLRLATPLALAELGWMAMGFVDIVMAGPLGPAAIGAGSLGNMLFFPIVICGTGMLLGMDTLVAQAFGAKDLRDCRRTLVNGMWLGVGLAPVLAIVLWLMIPLLRSVGTNPRVLVLLAPYLKALLWGILPLMFYTAFRRYLQAMNIVRPVTFAAISANFVNIAGDWALMYGHLGARAMGLAGSAWSTSIARGYIAAVLGCAIVWHERKAGNPLFHISWKPDFHRLRRLVGLGLPSAMQILIEGAVFGVVTVLAARLDEASLAAHSIAVNVVSTTYMVPLGISSAAAVRVGQAFGRRDRAWCGHRGLDGAAVKWTIHGRRGIGIGGSAGLDRTHLYAGRGGNPAGIGNAANCSAVSTVRRISSGGHGRAPRVGGHAVAHAGAPGGLLGDRNARGLRAVLPVCVGGLGNLGGVEPGAYSDRDCVGLGVAREFTSECTEDADVG